MIPDKNIKSIDFDNDDISYKEFNNFLENVSKNEINKISLEIKERGEFYLKEIEIKNKNREVKKRKQISYIIKHSKNKYMLDELNGYSFQDIQNIYNEVKTNNKSIIVKIIDFLFGID